MFNECPLVIRHCVVHWDYEMSEHHLQNENVALVITELRDYKCQYRVTPKIEQLIRNG